MPAPSPAVLHLRTCKEGVLIADAIAERVRFVIAPRGRRLVFPATPAMLAAEELILFIPEEDPADGAELQLALSAQPADPSTDDACDRWSVYHGQPRLTRWASCRITLARFRGQIVEDDSFDLDNPIAADEPPLCRLLNADPVRLAMVCAPVGVEPKEPVAVGVDPWGIDIRARFGIVRIPFDPPVPTPSEAASRIELLLKRAGA